MDAMFPFGFPAPTAFYLVVYVVMLVVHVVFMNYVVVGCAYLALAFAVPGRQATPRWNRIVAQTFREWLPVALSLVITAGITPLLFVQILYRLNFYTANLLLFHRWMAILPVLIVAFYLLYLLRTQRIAVFWPTVRAGVAVVTFACILFTGWAWTENHLLSLAAGRWPQFYESGSLWYRDASLPPRLGMWLIGGVPTAAALLALQFRSRLAAGDAAAAEAVRRWAIAAGVALAAAAACGVVYALMLPPAGRGAVLGVAARPYLVAAALGAGLQAIGWIRLARATAPTMRRLALPMIGVALTLLGMAVVRECLRLATIDIEALFDQHARAARVGGFGVYLAFFGINAVVIAWCVRLVRRSRRK